MRNPLEEAAYAAAQDIYDEKNERLVVLDPLTIMTIANIIINVIRLLTPIIQRYYQNVEGVVEAGKNPSVWNRLLVKWKVRQVLRQYKDFNVVMPSQIEEAVLRTLPKYNAEEVETIIQYAIYKQ